MTDTLYVQMFGSFSVSLREQSIQDKDNRSRKMWVLLAYLLFHREKKIPQSELFSILWKDEDSSSNPVGMFKVLLHRTRQMLTELHPDLGKQLIKCKNGEYFINPDFLISLDIEDFEQLRKKVSTEIHIDKKQLLIKQALTLYQGDFLQKFADEDWIVPITTYYHGCYTQLAKELLHLYETEQNYTDMITLCTQLCATEQYEDIFYSHLLYALIQTEQYTEAVRIYQNLRTLLSVDFGVQPSQELQQLYRKARQGLHSDLIDIQDVPKLMHAASQDKGALYCDIDIFKHIYHFSARGLERNGTVLHLILINITDLADKPLAKRSLTVCVKNLRDFLCTQLRCGDIVSMCSPSQFLVLLPNANFENSQKVVSRLVTSFYKKYPHTPAKLTHYIQPVIPINID